MKAKVNRLGLISAIEKAQVQARKDYEAATTKYNRAKIAARQQHIKNVRSYLKAVEDGGETLGSYEFRTKIDEGVKWPNEPKEPNDGYIPLIAKLKMFTDEQIVVDDKEAYFRFI